MLRSHMKKKIYEISFLCSLLFLSAFQCSLDPKLAHQNDEKYLEALAYAEKTLPKNGKLVQRDDGYVYLKVSDDYIHDLYKLIKKEDSFKKPPYFRRDNAPGAHISVIYKNENITVKEINQNFDFELSRIKMVHQKEGVSYVILEVHAPKLEKLRESYGLSSKLHGHEFHISIAKKKDK